MMKVLVAALCALAAVTATPLLGKEQCAKGPSVWCVNVQTADQCGAVTHCQQTVWNRPVVKSLPCDVCKEVMTAVASFVKDNVTQSEMMSVMQKACEFLPNPVFVTECKKMIQQYFPIVINLIVEETSNPEVACCSIGLCKSLQQHLGSLKPSQQLQSNEIPDVELSKMVPPFMANVPFLFPLEKEDHTDKDVCGDCLKLISDIQDNLKSNSSFSRGLINNALKQCEQLGGGLSDMCKNYVNQYGDLVLQMMIQMDQPAKTICSGAGFCTEEKATPQEMPAKVIVPAMKLQPAMKIVEKSSLESSKLPACELCELVLQQVEKFLEDNRTEAHIKVVLENVCSILPSKYRDDCTRFVDRYVDVLIDFLESGSTPRVICMAIGLCSEREPQIVKLDSENGFANCEMCQLTMRYLDKILEKNSTKQKIVEALFKVCNFLPACDLDECRSVVKMYEPLIIELLLEELAPHSVCVAIGLCPSPQKPLLGTEKCMWGPSYWCKDLKTAGSCNAIEHCKRHVWN